MAKWVLRIMLTPRESNILPLMGIPGSAPVVAPNNYSGGSGGGSNCTDVSAGLFNTKHERQSNYNLAGSVTKTHGNWTHKSLGQ